MKLPAVNFINVLRTRFCTNFLHQKSQSRT
jgi:hypothetical protein